MTELGYGGIMTKLKNIWKQKWGHWHLTSVQIIILGFLGTILAGTLLLMLPWASRSGHGSSFWDALFTDVYKRQLDLSKVIGEAKVVSFDGDLTEQDIDRICGDAPKRLLLKGKAVVTLEAAKRCV